MASYELIQQKAVNQSRIYKISILISKNKEKDWPEESEFSLFSFYEREL